MNLEILGIQKKIKSLIKNNKFESAKKLIIDSIKEYPLNPSLIFELARIYLIQDNKKEAKKLFYEVLNIDNLDTYAMFELGKIALSEGDLEEAENIFKGILGLDPYDRFARLQLAKVYVEQNRLAEAKFELKGLLKTKAHKYAKFEIGKIYVKENRLEDAKQQFKKILFNYPDDIYTKLELGKVYVSQGKFEKAEPLFKQILAVKENDRYASLELSKLYILLGRKDEAKKTLNKADLKNIKDRQLKFNLVRIYIDLGNYDEALKLLFELEKEEIKDEEKYFNHIIDVNLEFSLLFYKKGNYNESKKYADKVLLLDPNNRRAKFRLANILLRKNRIDDAKAILEELYNNNKNDIQIKFKLAKVYSKLGQIDLALQYFTELLRTEKKYFSQVEIAKLYASKGLFRKAYKIFDEVENNELTTLSLAKAYNEQGNIEKAMEEIDKSLSLFPNDSFTELELARIFISFNDKDAARDILIDLQSESNALKALTELLFMDISDCKYEDAMFKYNKVKDILENSEQVKNFLCYKLGIPFENPNDYLSTQLTNYSYLAFTCKMETGEFNFYSKITNAKFNEDIDISSLYNWVKNQIEEFNPRTRTLFDKYILEYGSILGKANDIKTNKIAVFTYSNSKDILYFYPISNEYYKSTRIKKLILD